MFVCEKFYLMISSPSSCMGSWHSKPPSHVTTWVLWCLPRAVCVGVIGCYCTARDRVKPFHLIHELMTRCQLAPASAGALTAMTLMTWSGVIIFPWSPKCMWNKAMINLSYRTYLRINGHAVIELYVKWSPNSTKKHISWSVLCTKSYWIEQWIFSLHLGIQ